MSAFNTTISTIKSLDPSQFSNDVERFQAKEALRKALVRMETPFERIWALSFENPPLIAGLRICVDLGVWKNWTAVYKEKGEAELTLEQIVALCEKKPEANLLRELGRINMETCLTNRDRTLPTAHISIVHARRDWTQHLETNNFLSRSRR